MFLTPIEVLMRVNSMTVEIIEKAVIKEIFLEKHCTNGMLSEAIRIIEKAEKFGGLPQSTSPNYPEQSSSQGKTILVKISLLFKDHSKMMDFVQSMKN